MLSSTLTESETIESQFSIPLDKDLVLTATGEVSIHAINEYGHFSGPYPYFDELPGAQLVEPYKESTLTVKGSLINTGLYSFVWKLQENGSYSFSTGSKISVTRNVPGLSDVSVHVYDTATNTYVSTYKTFLIVK